MHSDEDIETTNITYSSDELKSKLDKVTKRIEKLTALKDAIDKNGEVSLTDKDATVLATCGDQESWTFDALRLHYECIGKYLNWEPIGSVYAKGMYTREDIENSSYPQRTYKFGNSL